MARLMLGGSARAGGGVRAQEVEDAACQLVVGFGDARPRGAVIAPLDLQRFDASVARCSGFSRDVDVLGAAVRVVSVGVHEQRRRQAAAEVVRR